jgi:hypothetical protein
LEHRCSSERAQASTPANLEEIKAYLNHDLKVKVNGLQAQLKDEQGNAVLPITYEGNTYLPVRAVAGALKVAVDFGLLPPGFITINALPNGILSQREGAFSCG